MKLLRLFLEISVALMLMAAWKPHSYIEPTSAAGVEKHDRASELTTNTAENKCNDGGVPPKKHLQSQVER